MLFRKFLGLLAYMVGLLLKMTLRVTIVGRERLDEEKRYIFAFWHGKQFMPALFFRGKWTITALVSASRDGQIMASWLNLLGYKAIRGSSNRKAVSGLVLLLKALRDGNAVGVTPDGPRGPIYCAKHGVAYLATKTGVEFVPFGSAFSRRWLISSWDRYEIPKPFARGVFVIGKPVHIPSDCDQDQATRLIEKAIRDADLEATLRLHGAQDLLASLYDAPEQSLDAQCPSAHIDRATG